MLICRGNLLLYEKELLSLWSENNINLIKPNLMTMKHLFSMLAVAFAAIVMWSCSSGGGAVPLNLSSTIVQFADKGGTQKITVTAEPGWTATSSEKWLTLKQTDDALEITAQKNYSAKSRLAEVLVTAGEESQLINVSQKAGTGTFEGFTVSSLAFEGLDPDSRDDVTVNSLDGKYILQVTTLNPAYTWRVESDAEWLTTSVQGTQRGSNHFSFIVAANDTIEERKGTLTIISEYEGAKDDYVLTVIQNPTHSLQDPLEAPKIEW